MKFVLSVAVVLGTACAAQTAAQHPTDRQTELIVRHQVPASAYESDSVAPAPAQSARTTAHTSIRNPARSKHSHIAHRYSSVRRPRTGVAGRVQIPQFSVRRRMYRYKLFLQPPLPQCRSTPSELKKSLGFRALSEHKSSLRRRRSLMSPQTGFLMPNLGGNWSSSHSTDKRKLRQTSQWPAPVRLITHRESLFPRVEPRAPPSWLAWVWFDQSGNKSCVLRSTLENDLN